MANGQLIQALIERLSAEVLAWRFDAERQLVELGGEAVEPLLGALGSRDPAVRLHAVRALGRIGEVRALPALVSALCDEENLGAVAIAAEKVLVHWAAVAKQALLNAAISGAQAGRPRAIRALGAIGGGELVAPLRALLTSPSAPVRAQAAVALGRLLGAEAVEFIAPLLDDPDPWVRYPVAEALVELGSFRAEPVLRAALEGQDGGEEDVCAWARDLLDRLEELRAG